MDFDSLTFGMKDMVLLAGAVGPALAAAGTVWARLTRWQTSVQTSLEQLGVEVKRLEDQVRDRQADADKHSVELRGDLAKLNDQVGELVKLTAELNGWRAAQ